MEVSLSYDHQTQIVHGAEWVLLDYAANSQRPPVSFQGRVKEPLYWRQLMTALHRVVTSDARQPSGASWMWILDPIITVHPDEIFFEAFSTDQSVYARLAAPLEAFETDEPPRYGTTNIDFTWRLRESLQQLRSSRTTTFSVGQGGFGVQTQIGAVQATHFERKVDVPDSWLKGFLQVQTAFVFKPFLFDVRPVDLLTLITFMEENKPPRPPYGLRFEFKPDAPVQAVLEPWDERPFTMHGKPYTGYERTVRLWGRQRLSLLRDVLPYADQVTVGVLGRSLPHLYICHCGQYTFTLVLSGWTRNDWSTDGAFEALIPQAELRPDAVERAHHYLSQHYAASAEQIMRYTDLAGPELEQTLYQLCRAGRIIYDPLSRQYRLRELFDEPLDVQKYFQPNPRLGRAEELFRQGRVEILTLGRQETRPETKATATVRDGNKQYHVVASVDDHGKLRFGRCQCELFDTYLMAKGPCEHILALRMGIEAGD